MSAENFLGCYHKITELLMDVYPQETDYNVDTLFQFIEASELEFICFSDPQYWESERLIKNTQELRK